MYSEKLLEDFNEKNQGVYSDKILSQLKMSDLFINNISPVPNFFSNTSNIDLNLINNISSGFPFNQGESNNVFQKPMDLQFTNTLGMNKSNMDFSKNKNTARKFNTENPNMNKNSGESLNKETKIINLNKIHKPFVTNSCNTANNSNDRMDREFISKMRRRSIKNNKIVFVHSANAAAARKIANEAKVCF